ncbi:hypothetical protein PS925_05652 [Pseudomonas fluorescens]|uniref:Putative DNA-binding domain-containing protein n=1 Tax=Pseudomonas fluorescens TaxID=294 RepID=A0A5E7VR46_PSEFL|nr:DNA-binding domain-containing protein [Pseudomonas fluorescens]VVQ25037.1 hypothetical protein PS925_05652 [Pseudomonas fluorescens]
MTLEQLAALQASFAQALDASPSAATLPHGWFNGDADDWRRFSRYRSGLWQHQAQSLALTYPVLQALVGEDFLRTLAYDYGREYPSRHPDLSRFGEHLPAYLADYPATREYPYLPAMAALEWAVHCAARAEDAVALNTRDLAAMSSEQIDAQHLTLHAGCALLHSEWSIASLWNAHVDPAQAFPDLQPGRYCALVYRHGWQVKVREVDPAEAAALARFRDRASLGEALLAAQAQLADESPVSGLIDSAALLTRWLNEAVLIAVDN